MTLEKKTLKNYLICLAFMISGEIIISFYYCSNKDDVLIAFLLFFVLTVVSYIILFFLFKKSITDRIVILTDYVEKLQTTHQGSLPIKIEGSDEIARLAKGINKLLSELLEMNRKQQDSALHDGLTGVFNRFAFERAVRDYQNGSQGPLGVAVIDIDGLKLFNDAFGHAQGDALIRKMVDVITSHLDKNEELYRIGGDEFVAFLPIESQEKMIEWMKRLQSHFAKIATDNVFSYSASVGCAWGKTSGEVKKLVKTADSHMYEEKLSRRYKRKSLIFDDLKNVMLTKIGSAATHDSKLQTVAISLAKQENLLFDPEKNMRLLTEFYDIGKIGISEQILHKVGNLDEAEAQMVQKHSEIGWRIAQSIPALQPISSLILHHHEWWNGKGYPLGLVGEEIPLPCRVIAIVDAYDEMTGDRFAMKHEEALVLLRQRAGTQFDPRLVERFIRQFEAQTKL